MNVDIITQKKELRASVKEAIGEMNSEEKESSSAELIKAFLLLEEVQRANVLMLYAARTDEVGTLPLIENFLEQKKSVWLPWCESGDNVITPVRLQSMEDLTEGEYGILSPPAPSSKKIPGHFDPDIIVVPGVAFDAKGNRLGRGLGYYDQFLSTVGPHTLKIGLAFTCQMVSHVPVTDDDVPLNRIISS